ncbi:hypothetical protein BB558_005401 [Smittium angustum]|uniref:PhoD-like phosphatase domain-containing protein n=1 Tax=Smittium angustum TaxID=133377 RepID=A0A2U1J0J9_SMIAN|nr:hypothetical protein BB558_005401 [Smittium angustum]
MNRDRHLPTSNPPNSTTTTNPQNSLASDVIAVNSNANPSSTTTNNPQNPLASNSIAANANPSSTNTNNLSNTTSVPDSLNPVQNGSSQQSESTRPTNPFEEIISQSTENNTQQSNTQQQTQTDFHPQVASLYQPQQNTQAAQQPSQQNAPTNTQPSVQNFTNFQNSVSNTGYGSATAIPGKNGYNIAQNADSHSTQTIASQLQTPNVAQPPPTQPATSQQTQGYGSPYLAHGNAVNTNVLENSATDIKNNNLAGPASLGAASPYNNINSNANPTANNYTPNPTNQYASYSNIDILSSGVSSLKVDSTSVPPTEKMPTPGSVTYTGGQILNQQNQSTYQMPQIGNSSTNYNAYSPTNVNSLPTSSNTSTFSEKVMYGPVLQYTNTNLETAEWIGSVLVVTNTNLADIGRPGSPNAADSGPTVLIWQDQASIGNIEFSERIQSELFYIDTINNFKFWRAQLRLILSPSQERAVAYQVILNANGVCETSDLYEFNLPSQAIGWRMCCVNNSDISSVSKSNIQSTTQNESLWPDLLDKHNKLPFHVMLGTGGQINGDDLWKDLGSSYKIGSGNNTNTGNSGSTYGPQSNTSPYQVNIQGGELSSFIFTPSSKGPKFTSKYVKQEIPWNQKMENAVSKWYFNKYMSQWFKSANHGYPFSVNQKSISDALPIIPYMFCIDENDIFPGFGSYDSVIMNSPVFRGILSVATRYWSLFQAHAEWTEIQTNSLPDNVFISAQGLHWVRNLGPNLSVLGVDVTTTRSNRYMISPYGVEDIFRGIERRVGTHVQHLILSSSIPLLYPHLAYMESVLSGAKSMGIMNIINYASGKLNSSSNTTPGTSDGHGPKTFETVTDYLGENRGLLSLNSLWTNQSHKQERALFVEKLQGVSRARSNLRITFISGNVNCSMAGRFASIENLSPGYDDEVNQTIDNKFMIQLVSAGIRELPIDSTGIKALYMSGKTTYLNDYTIEKIYKTFTVDVDDKPIETGNRKLSGRRAFITIEESVNYTNENPYYGTNLVPITTLVAHIHAEIPNPLPAGPKNGNYANYGKQNASTTSKYSNNSSSVSSLSGPNTVRTKHYRIYIPNLNSSPSNGFQPGFNPAYAPQQAGYQGVGIPVLPPRTGSLQSLNTPVYGQQPYTGFQQQYSGVSPYTQNYQNPGVVGAVTTPPPVSTYSPAVNYGGQQLAPQNLQTPSTNVAAGTPTPVASNIQNISRPPAAVVGQSQIVTGNGMTQSPQQLNNDPPPPYSDIDPTKVGRIQ